MKKRILLFTSSIAILSLSLSSNSNGPITSMNGNRTGSQGSTANCSTGSGCHAVNGTATSVLIYLGDSATGLPISGGWTPDKTYKLTIGGANTTGPTKFGFQISSVFFNGTTEQQAGTLSIVSGTVASVKTSGSLSIVEHNSPINMTLGTYSYTVFWKAPAVTTIDSVRFYATVNCVNGDNTSSGDVPNTAMVAYHRHTTSVEEVHAEVKVNAYPNPFTNRLDIDMQNAESGTYDIRVVDLRGKIVSSETVNVNKNYQTSVNTEKWAAGIYYLQLKKGNASRTIAVVKQ